MTKPAMWRSSVAVSIALVIALYAAGCGSGSSGQGVASVRPGSTASSGSGVASSGSASQDYADAVAYSGCMRGHGVGNFPDPQSDGGFIVAGSGSSNPDNNPNFASANKACQHLLPNGGKPTEAQNQQFQAKDLKYSQCMRAHGVLNFPDPGPGGGLNLGRNESIDHNTPQFKAAFNACTKALNLQPPPGP